MDPSKKHASGQLEKGRTFGSATANARTARKAIVVENLKIGFRVIFRDRAGAEGTGRTAHQPFCTHRNEHTHTGSGRSGCAATAYKRRVSFQIGNRFRVMKAVLWLCRPTVTRTYGSEYPAVFSRRRYRTPPRPER